MKFSPESHLASLLEFRDGSLRSDDAGKRDSESHVHAANQV